MNNQISLAIVFSVAIGLLLIPWNILMGRISVGWFSVIYGVFYVAAGLIFNAIFGWQKIHVKDMWLAAFVCGAYVIVTLLFSYILKMDEKNLPIIAAIAATYPMVTAIGEGFRTGIWPSARAIVFILFTVSGIVGLSLSKGR